jgi:orotate phosphoribosyltransferase
MCELLAGKLAAFAPESVISPAVGGIVVGQDVARHLGCRHIFAEKDGEGGLVLRRGFSISPGERFVVAEDVVTRGGRVAETIAIVRSLGGEVLAAGAIVDRSGGHMVELGCPFVSLVRMNPETFAPDAIPPDLAAIPAIKPGSR